MSSDPRLGAVAEAVSHFSVTMQSDLTYSSKVHAKKAAHAHELASRSFSPTSCTLYVAVTVHSALFEKPR